MSLSNNCRALYNVTRSSVVWEWNVKQKGLKFTAGKTWLGKNSANRTKSVKRQHNWTHAATTGAISNNKLMDWLMGWRVHDAVSISRCYKCCKRCERWRPSSMIKWLVCRHSKWRGYQKRRLNKGLAEPVVLAREIATGQSYLHGICITAKFFIMVFFLLLTVILCQWCRGFIASAWLL